ncbi:MAG: hypothetical protein HY532_06845 [Chloroflexi bacterium]|nr:hypothetical protein [Chloroflexota bacterium]
MTTSNAPLIVTGGTGASLRTYADALLRRRLALGAGALLLALLLGMVLGLTASPALAVVLALPVLLVPVLWYRPSLAVYILVIGTVTFETFSLGFSDSLTDKIPFFRSLGGTGIPVPMPFLPVELLLLGTLAFVMLKRMAVRQRPLELGPFFWPIAFFMLAVGFGLVHGIGTGGNIERALWEARPQAYLLLAYLLVYNTVNNQRQLTLLLWFFLASVVVKGLVGTWRYLVTLGGDLSLIPVVSRSNSLLSHEESFFFALFFIFIIAVFLLRGWRKQVWIPLLLSPPVLLAFAANERRAGTLVLVLGVLVAVLLVYALARHRRRLLVLLAIAAIIAIPPYVLAFASSNSLIGEPARAIASVFIPDPRDLSSNTYREIETQNVKFNIMMDPLWGRGYGKSIVMFLDLPDLSRVFEFWDLIPHNTVLWLWLRVGFFGFVIFWYMAGRFIVGSSLIAKEVRDPYMQAIAVLAVAGVTGWLALGLIDMGFADFRVTLFVGILIALASRLPSMASSGPESAATVQVQRPRVLAYDPNSAAARLHIP